MTGSIIISHRMFIHFIQLEPYMTEDFLMRSFELMGEKPEAIKVMRNKHTGLPAGFGFCQFRDEKQAMEVLHKLNGKIIPYSQPVFLNII